jgi:predicted DNA-binding transcriptional regulator AlpA
MDKQINGYGEVITAKVISEELQFFENLPTLLKPEQVMSLFGFSIKTIYDWRYRGKRKNNSIPKNLFLKFNKKIFIRTEVLKLWIASQNP